MNCETSFVGKLAEVVRLPFPPKSHDFGYMNYPS
jgi:hypothetical protein